MSKEKIIVFTHGDLDGVVSYLILCWLYGRKLDYVATTPMKLEQDFIKWEKSNKEYDRMYFLDLDVTKIGNLIDYKNTKAVVIDHHKTNLYVYKHAKTRIYNETSCSKLLYDTFFKQQNTKQLTPAQKTLIALADDWDSNTKSTPLSEQLNIVYHSMNNKFNSFVEDYYNGFIPFDKFKQNTIILYNKHKEEYLNTRQDYIFLGKLNFEDSLATVGAIFCDKFIQECCDYVFQKFNVDIAIAVLMNQKRIAVRRNSNNQTIDVSKFVQKIASGGGHEAAAGGSLTEEFIEFTKLLKPIK